MVEDFENEFSVDAEVDAMISAEETSNSEKQEKKPSASKTRIVTPDDFSDFKELIKNPDIGETISFVVKYVQDNEQVEGVNKTTGEKFDIGCKKKDGTVVRKDIITTDDKMYTVNSWELFYKLFSGESEFMKMAKAKKSFENIKVTITRNYNGRDAMQQPKDLIKLRDLKTLEEAVAYQKVVGEAMKNSKLFTVVVEDVTPK